MLDVIWFGISGSEKSRAGLLRGYAERLKADHMAHSRQDFTGVIQFDEPGRLPGL